MKQRILPFINNADFKKEVSLVLERAQKARNEADKKVFGNVIDPFSAVFDSQSQGISFKEWLYQEKSRQAQKTLQNAIGNFHQAIIGHVDGWEDLGVGNVVDLRNSSKRILAEMKNKYNTTKGNHKVRVYDELLSRINEESDEYTAYYVEIVPKSKEAYNKPFTPPDNTTGTQRPANERIRVIDGRSFYALATGCDDALDMLYEALPAVIVDIQGGDYNGLIKDPWFKVFYEKAYPFCK